MKGLVLVGESGVWINPEHVVAVFPISDTTTRVMFAGAEHPLTIYGATVDDVLDAMRRLA